jgi:tRNA G26 N,N-dimethylase Trm1
MYTSKFLDTAIQEYVLSCIQAIKNNREVTLKRLQYAYNELKDKPSLVKIDKALDVLRSSLPLFDRTIEAIRSRPQ